VFKTKGSLIKFFLIYGWNIVFNILLIKLYLLFIGTNAYIAGLFATVIVAINSFLLNKFYVFKG
jgi:putative flippase GtrA